MKRDLSKQNMKKKMDGQVEMGGNERGTQAISTLNCGVISHI